MQNPENNKAAGRQRVKKSSHVKRFRDVYFFKIIFHELQCILYS